MNIFREVRAKSTLAGALLRNVLSLPFRRSSAAAWLERLATEDLRPTAPDTWGRLEATSRCIACGLCDLTTSSENSPSALIMAGSRRPEDSRLMVTAAREVAKRAEEISLICPAGVPALVVAELIEDNAALLIADHAGRGESTS